MSLGSFPPFTYHINYSLPSLRSTVRGSRRTQRNLSHHTRQLWHSYLACFNNGTIPLRQGDCVCRGPALPNDSQSICSTGETIVILGRATGRVQIAGNAITAMPVNPAAKAPMRLMFDIRLTHTKRAVRYVADASIEWLPGCKEKHQREGFKQRATEFNDSRVILRRL